MHDNQLCYVYGSSHGALHFEAIYVHACCVCIDGFLDLKIGKSLKNPYMCENFWQFIYVIACVAVIFGIDCVSNAGRKLVIVQGGAEHYHCFLPAL